jgi:hypothetical protein
VQNQDLPDQEKTKQFDVLFQRLIETGINQVSKSIDKIKLDDGTVVTEPNFIREFLDNCEKSIWTNIKDRLEQIQKTNTGYNEVDITCENTECSKNFTTPFVFEQSNFFA